jgi:hypothetical protein
VICVDIRRNKERDPEKETYKEEKPFQLSLHALSKLCGPTMASQLRRAISIQAKGKKLLENAL